jgi:hypothetical protein
MLKFAMLAALGAALAAPQAAPADTPEAAVRTLLAGWREGDAARAASVLSPDFRLATLRKLDAEPHVDIQSRDSLVAPLKTLKPGGWDVRLDAVSVQSDATGIATVWAPYTFYLDGKKSHCGVETFQLYRLAEGWRIASFADTHLWQGEEAACPDR